MADAGIGPAGELDRLLGRQMTPLRIVVGGEAEGALDEQQVGVPDAVLDRGRWPGVAGVRERGCRPGASMTTPQAGT